MNVMHVRPEAKPETWSRVDLSKEGPGRGLYKGPGCARRAWLVQAQKGCIRGGEDRIAFPDFLRHRDRLGQGGGYSLRLCHLLPIQLPVKHKAESPCPPTHCSWRLRLQERACLCNSAVSLSVLGWARVVRAMPS